MICILAGNYEEARTYAIGQFLKPDEWFYPTDPDDLKKRENFHVLVVGSAGVNVPPAYFEKVWQLALERGRINRK